jgi:hypothetical protein
MLDPCYWCHKNYCRKTHSLAIGNYRAQLHDQAENELRPLVEQFYKFGWPPPAAVGELLALKPEQMTIDDHRLKALYLENRKGMSDYTAWEEAQKELVKLKKRSQFMYPIFGKDQMKKILAYQPKNPLEKRRWTDARANELDRL